MTHTSNWPEMVPILLQGLNQQCLYGTNTSRSQLFFSPFSYPNNLKLNNLLFPETIFNKQFDQINHLIQRRKKLLTKRQILDAVQYQKGNIVLATNIPVATPAGKSKELQMTVQGVYYVKQVFPTCLRLVHLFTGEERK